MGAAASIPQNMEDICCGTTDKSDIALIQTEIASLCRNENKSVSKHMFNKCKKQSNSNMSNLDLSIFKTEHYRTICNNDYSKCSSISRLLAALKYYSILNTIDNREHQNIFTHFINEIYYSLIDDFIHIINNHHSDLQRIHYELIS
eukprot:210960_1